MNETSNGLQPLTKATSMVGALAKATKASKIKSAKATLTPGKVKVKIKGV